MPLWASPLSRGYVQQRTPLYFIIMWVVLFVLALGIAFYFKVRKHFKRLSPLGTITLVTGAVKSGKSLISLSLAMRAYRKQLRVWRIVSKLHPETPKPLLYSNIPLGCEYVPLTTDIILRKQKIVPKSVVFIDEASLLADSQYIKDNEVNRQTLLFFKLFGHESHGGSMILNTQSISDLHYNIKRCISNYVYIQRTRFLPFVAIADVLEQRYADDGTVVSNQNVDVDDNLKHIIVLRNVARKYDCYCYSVLTDKLPSADRTKDGSIDTLKSKYIASFRDWGFNNDKK